MSTLPQVYTGPGRRPKIVPARALDVANDDGPMVRWSRRAGVIGGAPEPGWSPRRRLLAKFGSALVAWPAAIALAACGYAVLVAAIGAVKTVLGVVG